VLKFVEFCISSLLPPLPPPPLPPDETGSLPSGSGARWGEWVTAMTCVGDEGGGGRGDAGGGGGEDGGLPRDGGAARQPGDRRPLHPKLRRRRRRRSTINAM
jgi:hypothetical protein